MNYKTAQSLPIALLALTSVAIAAPAAAQVQVTEGPSPIPGANAQRAGDLTLRNRELAVTIAVETAPPYGVPPGSIVDAAPVVDGEIAGAGDTLTQVDLIPNNWSAWPNTYSNVEVVEDTDARAAVRVERDWGEAVLTTTYALERGSDRVHMVTEMRNEGEQALEDLLSGYVLWERSGYFFGIPGLVAGPGAREEIPEEGPAEGALASWNALYDENWAFAVHFPAFERYDYDGRDLYVQHTLEPGESRQFEGWFQVVERGELSALLAAETQRRQRPVGTVTGRVETQAGAQVADPAVVVFRDGRPYTWALGTEGRYELALPEGEYELYGSARAHSRSARQRVEVTAGEEASQSFSGLQAPGEVRLSVSDGQGPVDARISIAQGETPLIGFLGRSTFFTVATGEPGTATFPIAPGEYRFEVGSGAGFVSTATTTDPIRVPADGRASRDVTTETAFRPGEDGWYSADLHHHALGAEGVTPPEYAFRSQLAARLDLVFVSDHDTMEYLPPVADLADRRGVPFIPSVELSPSWGHFNPYPVEIGAELSIDVATANIGEVLQQGRDLGARVIQANHPTNPYGYFTSLASGDVPGGFDPGFDLIEINPCCEQDTWQQAQEYWNRHLAGDLQRFYPLTAGSDTHDVWTERSGMPRLFAQLEGEPTVERYVGAAEMGHSYATFGPLLFPRSAAGDPEAALFGEHYEVGAGEAFEFSLDLRAVEGLRTATLIQEGEPVATRDLAGRGQAADGVSFSPAPEGDTWYALVVEDGAENKAYSNPIWVETR